MWNIVVGDARITIIQDAVISRDRTWAEVIGLDDGWRERVPALFVEQLSLPSYFYLVTLPGARVLVDTGNPYEMPGWDVRHGPTPLASLAHMGVQPEEITHVVITHAHWDHYAGLTVPGEGGYAPAFPAAACFLHRLDRQPGAVLQERTFGVLERAGLLRLVDGDTEVCPGVTMLHTPGETPGHCVVRVGGRDGAFFMLGDLYHHPAEVDHPDLVWKGRDAAAALASRGAGGERRPPLCRPYSVHRQAAAQILAGTSATILKV